jgi:hypothetical protein
MPDFDPFDEDSPESAAEAWWFMGLLAAIGVMAVAAGTARWWRPLLTAVRR